ncbi:MAG: hypothetical protein A4S09_11400 [Proteobacteria bacterium SG_bin7]|nr:MAG: hypothetical protein A4S09_11400 [Proteobacteria bacterium SG_bin7]
MNVGKKLRDLSVLLTLGFALFQYQNCAPVQSTEFIDYGNPGRVGIIDDFNRNTQLKFVESEVVVPSNVSDIQVDGLCSSNQDGSVLSWRVINEANEVVSSGHSTCDLSGFRVYLSQLNQLPCGKSHSLRAQFGFDKGDEVPIVRDCQN